MILLNDITQAIRRWFTAGIALAFLGGPAFAGPCDHVKGDLFGICNAYCVAQKCQNGQHCNGQSCTNLRNKFFSRAGYAIPCDTHPSISVVKETNGVVENPLQNFKLVVGQPVTWNYMVNNTGNVAVKVNSIVDQGSNNVPINISCNPALPANLAPKGTLQCSASGSAILGTYANTVTVSATAGATAVQATASGSYVGANPGLKLILKPNNTTVTTGAPYSWAVTLQNTGSVDLSGITYTNNAGADFSACPTTVAANSSALPCSSADITAPDTAGIVNIQLTASTSFVDGNNIAHAVSDTESSSITVIPPPNPIVVYLGSLVWGDIANTIATQFNLPTTFSNAQLVTGEDGSTICSLTDVPLLPVPAHYIELDIGIPNATLIVGQTTPVALVNVIPDYEGSGFPFRSVIKNFTDPVTFTTADLQAWCGSNPTFSIPGSVSGN